MLATYLGESSNVALTSDAPAMAGVVRSFTTVSAVMDEVRDARVFGGIHFRTADNVGQAVGVAVAQYIIQNALQPVHGNLTGQLAH